MIEQAVAGLGAYPESILHKGTCLHSSRIFKASEQGDRLAQLITTQAIKGLGMATANVVNLFNPSQIVFGGGVFNDPKVIEKNNYVCCKTYAASGGKSVEKKLV